MSARGVLAALLLSGCAVTGAADRVPPNPSPGLVPDRNGLAVVGTGLRIDFDRAPAGVIAALDRLRGAHRPLPLETCPAGILRQYQWGDLILTFTDERFVGWRQAGASAGLICGAASRPKTFATMGSK